MLFKETKIGALILIFVFCLTGAEASSASTDRAYEVEASGLGSSPAGSGFHNAYGFSLGFGVMLNNAQTLQGRIDFSPLEWKRTYFGNELLYKRQVIALSSRFYKPTYSETVKFFGQVGVEVSSDKKESMDGTWVKTTSSKTNIGITPGVGIEFGIGPDVGFIISGRYHIITDSYFDLMAGIAVYF